MLVTLLFGSMAVVATAWPSMMQCDYSCLADISPGGDFGHMGIAKYGLVTGANCVITTSIPTSGFVAGESYVVTVTSAHGLARKLASDHPGFAGQHVVDHGAKVTQSTHDWLGTTDTSATFRALCGSGGSIDEMWVADPVTVAQDITTTTKTVWTTMSRTAGLPVTTTATRTKGSATAGTATTGRATTTSTTTSSSTTMPTSTTSTQNATSQCPVQQPELGEQCNAPQASCPYGEECCCGQCGPSFMVVCGYGIWQGYFTDRCLAPCPEPDGGTSTTASSSMTMPTSTTSTQNATSNCPTQQPELGKQCNALQVSCPYGEECCCGQCGHSFMVECANGTWRGYKIDRCLAPCPEPDGGITSVAWSAKGVAAATSAIMTALLM